MAGSPPSNRGWKFRLSTSTELAALGGLIVAVAVTLTVGLILWRIEGGMADRAMQRIEINMKLAHVLLRAEGGSEQVRIEGGRLVAANGRPLEGDFELPDSIAGFAGGTATLFRGDLRVSTNVLKADGSRAVGTRLAPGPVYDAVLKQGRPFRGEVDILGVPYFTAYDPLFDQSGTVAGILYVGVKRSEYMSLVTEVFYAGVFGGLTLILLGGGTMLLSVRRCFRPLIALRSVMADLAAGRLTAEVPRQERDDEIGGMVAAVQVFKDNMLRAARLEAESVALRAEADAERARTEAERAREASEDQRAIAALGEGLDALANGILTHQVTEDFAPKTEKLKADFNATATRLRETMTTIAIAIRGMTGGTGDISQAADDLSKRTEQQARSLEQIVIALKAITDTVRRTTEGAGQAQRLVTTAKTDAEHSGEVVRDTVEAMGEIAKSAGQVSQIVGVIDEIAFQTNLLALNAGVEAARAVDAGRGFAVVASEVRALAQRSAEAAKEIKRMISTSSQQVERGVKLVADTGDSLQRIAAQVAEVYTAIGAIAASAREQSGGLHEVNAAITQMDQVTQQNAAMVEESTAASHGLARDTAELKRLTDSFQLGAETPTPRRRLKVIKP